jgi:hypothetical protein
MIGGTPFCWACLEADSCHRVHPSSGTVDLVGHTSCFMCYLILSWHIAGSSSNLFLKLDTDSYIFSAEPVVLQWKVHTGKDTCTGTKEQKASGRRSGRSIFQGLMQLQSKFQASSSCFSRFWNSDRLTGYGIDRERLV